MNIDNGRKLETVIRVLGHCEANPDDSTGFTTFVTQLRQGRLRAEALATQQRGGTLEVRAATARRKELRADIHHHMLVPIARVAESATVEEPEVDKVFRLPRFNARGTTWRTAARAIAGGAQVRKELFLRHGMSEAMLNDLVTALDQYDAAAERGNTGRGAHVGATADLDAVMRDNMRLVDLLDGLNRYRFRDDAEKLAAWESARNVPTPVNGRESLAPAA